VCLASTQASRPKPLGSRAKRPQLLYWAVRLAGSCWSMGLRRREQWRVLLIEFNGSVIGHLQQQLELHVRW
jgi:hypothetical protein